MVFRRLLAALALCAACGEAPGASVSIAMALDTSTCGGEAEELQLNCESTIWIRVFSEAGATLAVDCVPVNPGGQPLSTLGATLGQRVSLGELPANTPLQIALSVFASTFTECPQSTPSQIPILAGVTSMLVLSEQKGAIELDLVCLEPGANPPSVPDDGECLQCDTEMLQCFEDKRVRSCQVIAERCGEQCQNASAECVSSCDVLSQHCYEGELGPSLSCEGFLEQCLEECGADGQIVYSCTESCQNTAPLCEEASGAINTCLDNRDTCLLDCVTTPTTCLSQSF